MLASLYPQMASMACRQKVGVWEHILPYRSLAARRCGRNSLVPNFSNICTDPQWVISGLCGAMQLRMSLHRKLIQSRFSNCRDSLLGYFPLLSTFLGESALMVCNATVLETITICSFRKTVSEEPRFALTQLHILLKLRTPRTGMVYKLVL